jgi:two-component system, cell cycle response regulator
MARILVIEDNPINLELMTYLLRAWGHEPVATADGEAGIEQARRERPDLIVCDIQLPGIDGYEVAQRLKAKPSLDGVPLIAVTAYAMMGDRDRALQAGFDGHFSKPIDPATFMVALSRFLPSASETPPAPPPAAPPAQDQRPLPNSLRAPKAGLVVLMVDDTQANLSFKLSLLEPAGYAVLTAGGGDEALAVARAHRVDLILSDVMMAHGNGFELLASVRADPMLTSLPFVFLTATARDDGSRERGLSLGADAYLLRPIEPAQLLTELRARLGSR